MAEAGRCYFACANSINAGQTQLINQPSLSVKQFCYSERRQVRNQACAYLSLRHKSPPAILGTQRKNRISVLFWSHPGRDTQAHALWLTSQQGLSLFRNLAPRVCSESKTPGAAQGNLTLTGGLPSASKWQLASNDNFNQNGFLKHVVTQIFISTTNTFIITHLSHVQ